MLTVEEIAEQVYERLYATMVGTPIVNLKTGEVEGLKPAAAFAKWEHREDLIELTRYRLDNPQAPLGSHHAYYCALLDARDEQDPDKYPQKRFEFLSIEDVEQDLLVVKAILQLRPEWENYGGGEPPAWEEGTGR